MQIRSGWYRCRINYGDGTLGITVCSHRNMAIEARNHAEKAMEYLETHTSV